MKKLLPHLLVLPFLFALGAEEPRGGKIVIEAGDPPPKPKVFYSSQITGTATVDADSISQTFDIGVKILQGDARTITYHTRGLAEVTAVEGKTVAGWAVRWGDKKRRYIDITLTQPETPATDHAFQISAATELSALPSRVIITNLAPDGEHSAGFHEVVSLRFGGGVTGTVTEAAGFLPVHTDTTVPDKFQTSTGGVLSVQLNRSGAKPAPVELSRFSLDGELAPDKQSARFLLKGTATVSEADAAIPLLRGRAVPLDLPSNDSMRLRLAQDKAGPYHELVFAETGTFSLELQFVAEVFEADGWSKLHFDIATGAVSPLQLRNFSAPVEFRADSTLLPEQDGKYMEGFLPASGQCHLAWKLSRKIGEGKLFFSTSAEVETMLGAGLLRQEHRIDYRILQGELDSLAMDLANEGEILAVEGPNVVGWSVEGDESSRLVVRLNQPITKEARLVIRTQQTLGTFPVRAKPMRVTPVDSVRHAGHIRVSNQGSVRLEPVDLQGLTQLAPEQFPGGELKARQIFVYRFPAANYDFAVSGDRIQPEVNVSQLVIHHLAETDRLITADIELDIREAPIREWDMLVPADYSVVSVTGAAVGDSITATEEENGMRNVKVIFSSDISGRQLLSIQLEKNIVAGAGEWIVPKLAFPEAETVRGDVGIAAAPGYRVEVGTVESLVEKPLSYFPKQTPNLQQAFRIRERGWSATMQVELLEKSVQADVFHLYSLSEGTAYGSVLINYIVTGAPVSELRIELPEGAGNAAAEGHDIRGFHETDGVLYVTLHQPLIGAYTLLVTFEESLPAEGGTLQPGRTIPLDVQGERGFVQVVSPMQVQSSISEVSEDLLALDALELPAEFRLLSAAPSLGAWQYTSRPFDLALAIQWFEPGSTAAQIVEFSEIKSRVSPDGELVTDVLYFVKSRDRRALKLTLPPSVRLWSVTVGGKSVTARSSGEDTLIPLPAGSDPNEVSEVQLRLGRPVVEGMDPVLTLPLVDAPVLKTEWTVSGDERHHLVATGGNVSPDAPAKTPTGFQWISGRKLGPLAFFAALLLLGSWLSTRKRLFLCFVGIIVLAAAVFIGAATAMQSPGMRHGTAPLQISLPVLTSGEKVELEVDNVPLWRLSLSWPGIFFAAVGLAMLLKTIFSKTKDLLCSALRTGGGLLLAIGLLMQRDAGRSFFLFLLLGIFLFLIIPSMRSFLKRFRERKESRKFPVQSKEQSSSGAALLLAALTGLSFAVPQKAEARGTNGFLPFDKLTQSWTMEHGDRRVTGQGKLSLTGKPGDSFLLLRAPAVLTGFSGGDLRLSRQEIAKVGLCYIITIPERAVPEPAELDPFAESFEEPVEVSMTFDATFSFQLKNADFATGIALPTGAASVHSVKAASDRGDMQFYCEAAVLIEPIESGENKSAARILLSPEGNQVIALKPKSRDISSEETRFFVESSNLYLPGPGVINGKHRIQIRPAQGQVRSLRLSVPDGLTVSAVAGPVEAWQFDAGKRFLDLTLEPVQSAPFSFDIETQRGLPPLPAGADMEPLRVADAAGEIGLIALAFGGDAQPEKVESETLSQVNISDFDATLHPGDPFVLHRVYRYGTDEGAISVRVAPVDPEVRLTSKQVLSIGEERIVLGVNFAAEITRSGLFQLSFPVPDGYEVESLTGDSLHHWTELEDEDTRRIVLHLNGKTLGTQQFSLTLSSTPAFDTEEWNVPRFTLTEAKRHTGDLIVRPATGLRLRTITRQNVSEVDPRSLGSDGEGSLAFRLLQSDWNLSLGIEQLEPWVTGDILHELTLREGQTRTSLFGRFEVKNASVRGIRVQLPLSDPEEIKTLIASGDAVSDMVRLAPDSNEWEIRFKRRIVGKVDFRIEYERRGERKNDRETLQPAAFPESRQIGYHFAVRSGGRLEISTPELSRGWQRADWTSIPQVLRESGNRNAPVLTLRAVSPETPLEITAVRHSLAEALKLRVTKGNLTTVLSPLGEQLTSVDLTMEVIQRSSLTVGLPSGAELFSIFVNGESVQSVRRDDVRQFYILPGTDDRTATVRFVYSTPGDSIGSLQLISPLLNVPLENITWNVVAPKGYQLADNDGDLELKRLEHKQKFDKNTYLSALMVNKKTEAAKAAQILQEANDYLMDGDNAKASWAFNNVLNRGSIDEASNEDARVQLENLQTRQAVVGLNTRRQRLYIGNGGEVDFGNGSQIEVGIAENPVLQKGETNFRPDQLSQLLQGNTSEDNAALQRIATRLVRHQRATVTAPRAIAVTLPEEGTAYTFHRTVQVNENAPLALELDFSKESQASAGRVFLLFLLLVAIGGSAIIGRKNRTEFKERSTQEG
ncbi:MAG: hypothetical protein MI807_09625 [Verrucomicrobiales bacterium]|nr:hypothetical protein [Verrucomicrobiales bacterium]